MAESLHGKELRVMVLKEVAGGRTPTRHRLRGDCLRAGRGEDNDLVLHDTEVSRYHLEFRSRDGCWSVVDLSSRNGSAINGRPLLDRESLRPGDELSLGQTVLVFEGDAQDRPSPPAGETEVATDRGEIRPMIVGRSEVMHALRQRVEDLAENDSHVLLQGESGTGKELVAALLHERSSRREGPFVMVDCPNISETLAEADLFGIGRRIASEVDPRVGKVEMADGGTLFLDEIGDLSLELQRKLLRFLDDQSYEPVGSPQRRTSDVRVVAATNKDVDAMAAAGQFRQDLLYRLAVERLTLPPLREHRTDIPDLARFLAGRARQRPAGISDEAIEELMRRCFPGNVRDLRHAIERAANSARGGEIRPEHLSLATRGADDHVETLRARLLDGESFWNLVRQPFLERDLPLADVRRLVRRLHDEFGSYKGIAQRLGMDMTAEYKKFLNFLRDHRARIADE